MHPVHPAIPASDLERAFAAQRPLLSAAVLPMPDPQPINRRFAMRNKLTVVAVLALVAGGTMVASVATAAPPERSSTLRPWGREPAATHAPAETATPKEATRLVVIGQEADFTIIDAAPAGDSPGDQILLTDTLHDQTGRRIGRDEARCTIMFGGDVLCDATFVLDGRGQLTIEGVGLTFAVTGGTG
jgi:hypothetical protein